MKKYEFLLDDGTKAEMTAEEMLDYLKGLCIQRGVPVEPMSRKWWASMMVSSLFYLKVNCKAAGHCLHKEFIEAMIDLMPREVLGNAPKAMLVTGVMGEAAHVMKEIEVANMLQLFLGIGLNPAPAEGPTSRRVPIDFKDRGNFHNN